MYGTYCRLNVHVHASDMDVIRAARKKLCAKHKRSPEAREARRQYYKLMLEYHHGAQKLVRDYALI